MNGSRIRRRRSVGAITAGALFSSILLAHGGTVTSANWNDHEWVHTTALGAVDCADPAGAFASRGEGRAVSGSLLGVDLDEVAEARGVLVTNDGLHDQHTPPGANPAPDAPAWADPLDVGLLGDAINLDLGSGLLQLPLDNSTGVLGQFASANTGGVAEGAAGYITQSGGVATDGGSGYPALGTFNLHSLVASIDPGLAGLLGGVTDLSLELGAVTGRATLDGCDAHWNGVSPLRTEIVDGTATEVGNLSREYLATSADLVIATPTLLGDLISGVNGAIVELEDTVNGLTADEGVLDDLLGAVNGLLGTLISGVLRLGEVSLTLTAEADTSAIWTFLDDTVLLSDPEGIVNIDFARGEIRISTVPLLQAAYPENYTDGLNGLPPNTDPLQDEHVLNTLANTIDGLLAGWLTNIESLLNSAIDAVEVGVTIEIGLGVSTVIGRIDIGHVTAQVSGPLTDLETDVTTHVDLGLLDLPILGSALKGVVEGLINTLVVGLVQSLASTVGDVLEGVLRPLGTLPAAVRAAADAVLTTLSGLYAGLLLPGGTALEPVLSIVVNAQNAPFTGGAETAPSDWAFPPGRYDVAALRVAILEGFADGVVLYLGRGSVGPGCSIVAAAQTSSPCVNY